MFYFANTIKSGARLERSHDIIYISLSFINDENIDFVDYVT